MFVALLRWNEGCQRLGCSPVGQGPSSHHPKFSPFFFPTTTLQLTFSVSLQRLVLVMGYRNTVVGTSGKSLWSNDISRGAAMVRASPVHIMP